MKKKIHIVNTWHDLMPWRVPKGAKIVYSEKYHERIRMLEKQIEETDKEKVESRKEYYRKKCEDISDSYIKKLLAKTDGLPAKVVDEIPELTEITRLSIKTKRILKQKHNI